MKGHDYVIEMRKHRRKPEWVFINDYACKTDCYPDEHPTICVHGDSISELDLRFVIGLRVSINSEDVNRAKALYYACIANKAAVVATSHGFFHG